MSPGPYPQVHDPLVNAIAVVAGVILTFLQPLARWVRRLPGPRFRRRQ